MSQIWILPLRNCLITIATSFRGLIACWVPCAYCVISSSAAGGAVNADIFSSRYCRHWPSTRNWHSEILSNVAKVWEPGNGQKQNLNEGVANYAYFSNPTTGVPIALLVNMYCEPLFCIEIKWSPLSENCRSHGGSWGLGVQNVTSVPASLFSLCCFCFNRWLSPKSLRTETKEKGQRRGGRGELANRQLWGQLQKPRERAGRAWVLGQLVALHRAISLVTPSKWPPSWESLALGVAAGWAL